MAKRYKLENFENFLGKGNSVFAIGVVEDIADPLTLGRVKVRCFGFHPADRSKVPTVDLPWAQVLQSSASTSGVGFSPNYLKPDSWVFVIFLDGETAQFPLVLGAMPRVHAPSGPSSTIGNSAAGYHTKDSIYSGAPTPPNPNSVTGEFYPQPQINPGGGSTIADDGSHLTKQNIPNWPLKIYKSTPARGDYGLACKDADSSLFIHYASALALEELARRWGTPPKINSAYRTPAYNATLQGAAKNSQHLHGRAFDIPYSSIGGSDQGNLARFAQTAVQCGFVGFGLYPTFIHIDTGSGRTWNGAKAAWFIDAIKQAGWYPGKPGLKDVRTSNTQTSNNSTSSANTDPTTTGSTTNEPQTANEAKDLLAEKMRAQGYNEYAIAAAQAHAYSESGFSPTITNGIGATGMFQWLGDRKTGMLASGAGGSASGQIDYFLSELAPGGARAGSGNALKNATSLDAANQAMASYEGYALPGAGGYYGDADTARRLAKAQEYLGGAGAGNASIQNGFRDASGSLPYGGYQGKPSTHHSAVGFNGNMFQPELLKNNDARIGGFPTAGEKGTVGEPPMSEAPQYPFNFTYASLTGHLWEMDDTPGAERVNLQHRSGSRLAISSEGTTLIKSQGNMYNVTSGDTYHLTMGGMVMSVKDDIGIRSTSDMTLHADGTVTMLSRNDSVEHISGKKDILVAETMQIKCNRLIIEAENIDFVAAANITMEAGGDIKIRSGGNMATSSGGDTTVFSKGGYHADAASLHWLEGQAKEIPEMTGKSTDLGTAPARSIVKKVPYLRKNPDNVITAEDAMQNYGQSDPTKRNV
jgi:uncharacterized protein (DUF2345 family)